MYWFKVIISIKRVYENPNFQIVKYENPNFQIVKSVKLVDRFICFFLLEIADAYANNPTEQNLSISL